jgi:hypothetical protein
LYKHISSKPVDEAKLAKQNVKYDSSTGKVYEELGACSRNNPAEDSRGAITTSTLDYNPYGHQIQSYQTTGSYPYGQYMGSFGSPYATASTTPQFNPYDR